MKKRLFLLLFVLTYCYTVSSNESKSQGENVFGESASAMLPAIAENCAESAALSKGKNQQQIPPQDGKNYAKEWREAEKEIGQTVGAKSRKDYADWTFKCKEAGWSDEKIEYYRWLINEHYGKHGKAIDSKTDKTSAQQKPTVVKEEKPVVKPVEKEKAPVEIVKKEEPVVEPVKQEETPVDVVTKEEPVVEPKQKEESPVEVVQKEEPVVEPVKQAEIPAVEPEEKQPTQVEVAKTEEPKEEKSAEENQKETTDTEESQPDLLSQEDAESDNTYVPGLLHSSRDVYDNNTSYTFSIAYFKARGYDGRFQNICINNFQFNSLVTGRATYSQWGGLNHVMRYPETITGLNVSTFNFGDIGGSSNYSTRASSYRKQIRVGYSLTNRTYTNRLQFTYASGVLNKGWSIAASVSARFGNDLSYVDGVSYNGYSYFLALEKKFNSVHALNLTAFGAPTVRGMQGNSVNEAYDITGSHYYNPNWGWYNGKKRNARVRNVHEPVIQLTHYYTPDSKLNMTTTLTATFGRNSTTSLNWYDAQDPRPDYYRYLPSYQIDNGDTTATYYDVLNAWQTNANVRQINWDRMYEVNQLAAYQGKRAQYMIENRIYNHVLLGGATNAIYTIDEHIKFVYGVDIRGIKQRNYKTIGDLLGGLYWLDVDKYSEGDFPDDANVQYNDLDNKDKQLHEGDVFGYDYDYHIMIQKAWVQFLFSYNKVDFNLGASIGGTEFWRFGHMKNGRFQDDSKGRSKTQSFCEYAFKGGLTYKINGRNYIVLNGLFESNAPSVLNSFVAPRIRNKAVDNLKNEQIGSVDLSYIMKYPVVTLRLTGYFTQINDMTKLVSFYHDGMQSMVNYSMTGIDQRHMGVELGAEIKMGSMFSLILAGTYGDYRYSDRANVTINAENGSDFEGDVNRTVYWKNYHVAGTPQAAGTIGIKFNHKYWWVNINANYFDKIYCDLNPERRTTFARGSLAVDDPAYIAMASQTRLKGQFTLDASISKSWRIKNYIIGFNVSVTNITNNKNLITTAWEQYRYDYTTYNPDKFQNKYYYAFGTTFFAGLNFQFN